MERFKQAAEDFDENGARLRFTAHQLVVARSDGTSLRLPVTGSGEYHLWVLAYGLREFRLVDRKGDPVIERSPYTRLPKGIIPEGSMPPLTFNATAGQAFSLTLYGSGCAAALLLERDYAREQAESDRAEMTRRLDEQSRSLQLRSTCESQCRQCESDCDRNPWEPRSACQKRCRFIGISCCGAAHARGNESSCGCY